MYQYSSWLLFWSILYRFKWVKYPPLVIVLLFALLFSSYLLIKYKAPLCYLILSILLHILPILLIDDKRDYITVSINIVMFLFYLIIVGYILNINILEMYHKDVLKVQKNPSIEYVMRNILFKL
jgi:hypothetical protein